MSTTCKHLLAVALLLAAGAGAARAQFFYSPRGSFLARRTQAAAFALGAQGGFYGGNPYFGFGFNPYYYSVLANPYGGYLNGVANVTEANGQYEVLLQQAKSARQQVIGQVIDNRRKLFDELKYERENTPSAEDLREQEQHMMLRRARNDPPSSEIWSGQALNSLLQSILKIQGTQELTGADVPLEQDTLNHINVNTGATLSNVSMFQGGKKLQWPLVLRQGRFSLNRETINELVPRVLTAKASGRDDDEALTGLLQAVENLRTQVKNSVEELGPSDYVRAMRYANQLSDAVKTLPEPEADNYLSGKWAARGKDVGELIDNMKKNGLKFGAVTPGQEAYYNSLYQSLRQYENSLSQLTQSQLTAMPPQR
jgi:hypothetical protein